MCRFALATAFADLAISAEFGCSSVLQPKPPAPLSGESVPALASFGLGLHVGIATQLDQESSNLDGNDANDMSDEDSGSKISMSDDCSESAISQRSMSCADVDNNAHDQVNAPSDSNEDTDIFD
jgi:hypothetical protein